MENIKSASTPHPPTPPGGTPSNRPHLEPVPEKGIATF